MHLPVLTLHLTKQTSKSGVNIGLVWSKMYTSKKCPFEDVTIIHCTTASHALGPCLFSLPFMTSLYIFHTFNSRNDVWLGATLIFLFTNKIIFFYTC